MNEMESKNYAKKFIVLRANKEITARNLKDSPIRIEKKERFDKYDGELSRSDFVLRETKFKPLNDKKKLGSHRLSELHSFRSKFK
jgi:hypothetical protein